MTSSWRLPVLLGLGAALYILAAALVLQWSVLRMNDAVVPYGKNLPALPRLVPLQIGGSDSLMWIMLAEEGIRDSTARPRFTHLDNPPDGRGLQWCSGPIWFLQLAGGLRAWQSGEPLRKALIEASLWWNPFIHLLLVLVAGGVAWRGLGPRCAIVLAFGLLTFPSMQVAYSSGVASHHALEVLFAVLTILLPWIGGFGFIPERGDRPASSARSWFVAGGLAAAAGLWVGAVVGSAPLVGLGLGVAVWLALEIRRSRDSVDLRFHPSLWRWWGWSGAAGSLFFFLLEYFPSHLQLQIDVNHPWYAACFAAGGEMLCRLTSLSSRQSSIRRDWPILGVCLLIIGSLPVAMVYGPPEWQALNDPWMRRMHDGIREFLPYGEFYGPEAWSRFARTFGLLPLALPLAVVVWLRPRLTPSERAGLCVTFVAAVIFFLCTMAQNRWEVFLALSLILLSAALLKALEGDLREAWLFFGTLALQAFLYGAIVLHSSYQYGVDRNDLVFGRKIVLDRTAQAFAAVRGSGDWRMLCEPYDSPEMEFSAGAAGLDSFYWENRAGLRAATLFMTDSGDAIARDIARQRGLTHIMVNESPVDARTYQHIRYGFDDPAQAGRSLAGRLSRREPPPWMHLDEELTRLARIPYQIGNLLLTQKYLVYDVDRKALAAPDKP